MRRDSQYFYLPHLLDQKRIKGVENSQKRKILFKYLKSKQCTIGDHMEVHFFVSWV
jgi:hypothetical protein